MKRLLILAVVLLMGVALTSWVLPRLNAASGAVVLRTPASVKVGAAWSVEVELPGAEVGAKISLHLFAGLQHFKNEVVTGTGGVARWDIPPETVTSAGQTLIVATYNGDETRQRVQVEAGRAESADLLTSSNFLTAYGDDRAMLIAILRDRYGNPPRSETRTNLTTRYPGGERRQYALTQQTGLAWTWFTTMGQPGRLRVALVADSARTDLEVMQMPGVAARIDLAITPDCVFDDGRDVIQLVARAVDAAGNRVVDGTLIRFMTPFGFGDGAVLNGAATLNLPAPTLAGIYAYTAQSGDARSDEASLQVVADQC